MCYRFVCILFLGLFASCGSDDDTGSTNTGSSSESSFAFTFANVFGDSVSEPVNCTEVESNDQMEEAFESLKSRRGTRYHEIEGLCPRADLAYGCRTELEDGRKTLWWYSGGFDSGNCKSDGSEEKIKP